MAPQAPTLALAVLLIAFAASTRLGVAVAAAVALGALTGRATR